MVLFVAARQVIVIATYYTEAVGTSRDALGERFYPLGLNKTSDMIFHFFTSKGSAFFSYRALLLIP